jgi:Spy/CpxP family protein refolding chaperone
MKALYTVRLAVAGLALIAGTAMIASATAGPDGEQCGRHGRHGHKFDHLQDRVDQLALDDTTRQAVRAILDQAREDRRARKDDMRAARAKMDELLSLPDVGESELMAQVEADQALHTEAHKAKLRTLLAIRALLTPAQWEALRKHPEPADESRRPGPESS